MSRSRTVIGQIQRAITGTEGDDSSYAEIVANDVKAADELVKAYALAGASEQRPARSDETGRADGEIASAVTDVAQGGERRVRMVEPSRAAVQEPRGRRCRRARDDGDRAGRGRLRAGRHRGRPRRTRSPTRGFAVVGEEVRKLAEESQSAAGQIASLIGEIRPETGRVVEVVASGQRVVGN